MGWGSFTGAGGEKLRKKSRDNSRAILPRPATLIPTLIRRGERKVAAEQRCNVQVPLSRHRERRVIERGRGGICRHNARLGKILLDRPPHPPPPTPTSSPSIPRSPRGGRFLGEVHTLQRPAALKSMRGKVAGCHL